MELHYMELGYLTISSIWNTTKTQGNKGDGKKTLQKQNKNHQSPSPKDYAHYC